MKRLSLIRHAKASWDNDSDFERTLHERGITDAQNMGRSFAQAGISPQLILTSPAIRARSTAELLAENFPNTKQQIVDEPSMYNADVTTLMQTIHQQKNDIDHLMLVGHNPGMTDLCNHMDREFRIDDLPTCSVVIFDFDIDDWADLKENDGTLVFFHHPSNSKAINRL